VQSIRVSVFQPVEGSVILGHKIPNLNCNLNENKCKGVVKAQIMIESLGDRKETIYAITYFVVPADFDDYRPVVEKMIDSFKIDRKGPVIQ